MPKTIVEIAPHEKLEMAILTGKPVSDDLILTAIVKWRTDDRYMFDEACDLLNVIAQCINHNKRITHAVCDALTSEMGTQDVLPKL